MSKELRRDIFGSLVRDASPTPAAPPAKPGTCATCGGSGDGPNGADCADCGGSGMARVAPAPAAPVEASRTRTFVASSESVDSYNSTIKAAGWDLARFNRNPLIPMFHSSWNFPVGKGRAYVLGSELRVDIEFAPPDDPVSGPNAEQALRWIDRGVMGVSVGFDPVEWVVNEDRMTGDPITDLFDPPIDYIRQQLLEISIVSIPANPDAYQVGRQLARSREFLRSNFGMPSVLEPGAVEKALELAEKRVAQLKALRPKPNPSTSSISRDELKALVSESAKTAVRAAFARRSGRTSGGKNHV